MRAGRTLRGLASLLVLAAALSGCTAEPAAEPSAAAPTASPSAGDDSAQAIRSALRALERRYDTRLGAAVVDTGTGRAITYRGDERFAFASTGKAFIAAAVLRHDSDEQLQQRVRYSEEDLLEYAPVTSQHVRTGMTVAALLDAMIRYSDNTAANLLVERLGGVQQLQGFLRSIGDGTTSVDRVEPDLNSAVPGNLRDTTTPVAFAQDLRAVLLGRALPERDRRRLEDLMRRSTTGGSLIRAGAPDSWAVADKSGSGEHGVRNDVALVRRSGGAPLVVVLLSSRPDRDAEPQDALIADATRVLADVVEP